MSNRPLLSQIVAAKIKEMIISGEIKAGSRLPSEQELAERLDVSIRSVREAEKALASCNVLEIRRGIGAFAAEEPGVNDDPLGFEFVEAQDLYPDLVEIRLIVEPEVFVLAAHRCTQDELDQAAAILKELKKYDLTNIPRDDEESHRKFRELDMQFHCVFYQASRNVIAMRLMPMVLNTIKELYVSYQFREWRASEQSYSRHEQMYNAIANKDDELIRNICRIHITNGSLMGGLKPEK